MSLLFLWLSYGNLIGFMLILWDKRKAIKNQYRIPEKTFFILAFLGGAFGIMLGMLLFHQKTKKASFFIKIYSALFIWIMILFAFLI